jgi:hypothetical protein
VGSLPRNHLLTVQSIYSSSFEKNLIKFIKTHRSMWQLIAGLLLLSTVRGEYACSDEHLTVDNQEDVDRLEKFAGCVEFLVLPTVVGGRYALQSWVLPPPIALVRLLPASVHCPPRIAGFIIVILMEIKSTSMAKDPI